MELDATPTGSRLVDLLKQGIGSARAGDAAAARQQLLAAISLQPDYEIGWLWLSWVTADPDEAAWYLRRVLAINPDHGQARERLAQLAREVARPAAWRCPFCGRTAAGTRARCHGCCALFAGADVESWLAPPAADRALLRATVAYLESPPGRTGKPSWHWTLGIAHLNLGNFPRALAPLRQAGSLSPGNGAISRLADALDAWLRREGAGPVVASQPAAGPPLAAVLSPAEEPAGRLVLVVDDSPTVRKIVAVTLECEGYRVVVAADGMQALAKLDEVIPDLVLLDIAMPRIDGYRVCRLLKGNERTQQVPVVMLSGKDGFFDRIRARAAGADDHLAKPVDRATLLAAVTRWIGAPPAASPPPAE